MAKTRTIQLCNWFVPIATDILLPNGDEPNFISSSKFCSSSLLLLSHQLFATYRNKYCYLKTVNDFAFQFKTFSLQNITDLDAGLHGKIQTAVDIRFSQSNSRIWQFPVLVRQSHIIIIHINSPPMLQEERENFLMLDFVSKNVRIPILAILQ